MREKLSISIDYYAYSKPEELPLEDQQLLAKAVEISKNAYAPYSEFKVGAAVLLNNGEVVKGSNQENAAYPSGLCAERVAIFSAGANLSDEEIKTVSIYADSKTTQQKQISPCGSCRQVISEYEVKQRKNIRILLMNSGGMVWEFSSCGDLLPLAFDFTALKKK